MKLADIKQALRRHAESHSQTPERRAALASEMADLMLYLIRIADRHGVDLVEASQQTLETEAAARPKLVSINQGAGKKN